MNRIVVAAAVILGIAGARGSHAQAITSPVSTTPISGGFTLAAGGRSAPIYVSRQDFPGVVRAARDLAADVARVTNVARASCRTPRRQRRTR